MLDGMNIGELSKPATVLIEKISEAVSGACKPFQLERVARAEAKVELIKAQNQIEVTDLQRRAMQRFFDEESQKQLNMDNITEKAIPLLENSACPEDIEADWITNFFDKNRIVSDDDMQLLWARVLAEEANHPGSFAKKTVNLLADLDKHDAELFLTLCGFCWLIEEEIIPLIFNQKDDIYKNTGINFMSLHNLEALGLIHLHNEITQIEQDGLASKITAYYFDKFLELTLPQKKDNTLPVGQVLLTRAGLEIASICQSPPIEGFFEYIRNRWIKLGYIPSPNIE